MIPHYDKLPDEGGQELLGRKVKVYRNLKQSCFSIKDANTNRVIAHADILMLSNVQFTVSEKTRQRVLREKKKYVHAYAVGILTAIEGAWKEGFKTFKVTYNPFKGDSFVGRQVVVEGECDDKTYLFKSASMLRLTDTGLYALLTPTRAAFLTPQTI